MNPLGTRLKARAQLAALKVAATLLPSPRPLVLLGADASHKLCQTIAQLGAHHVLIVTDKGLEKLGMIDPIVRRLKRQKLSVSLFTGVLPDPTFSVVEQGLAQLKRDHCDAVLAVGGGSSIDAAKVIALAATQNRKPQKLVGVLKARKPALPLFAIPTTAGTGSEVTVGAVISDDKTHQKALIIDPKVVPLATALDPRLMRDLPAAITADTGLDALTHALEAWISEFANHDTDVYAGAAVRLIFDNLPKAYTDGHDLAAREAMALASHYAGLAINKAGLGYVHAIAHQLGAHYGLPHGRANAIVLPYVLDFNLQAAQKRLAQLARETGLAGSAQDDAVAARRLVSHVRELIASLNIPHHVAGVRHEDFNAIIEAAFHEAHGTYAVPRYMAANDCQQVLEALGQD
ncbi:iron-containing alcohol dehydrogenase [Mangrovitalea sediminis]|uniref:iron-containing alcohol dehydrogenase n=1 Tax=Mangrovitalea sediminis TaxID=1982043 RepID=UPI000BE5B4E3|nr:iron-containing alcohol dehydrogenase [Mangrovitalea sediminis]